MADNFAYNPHSGSFRMRNGEFMLARACPPLPPNDMTIWYEWADLGNSYDLDTNTTFLGVSVGWSVGGGQGGIIVWPSGDNTQSGPEEVKIWAATTLAQGKWSGQTTIICRAGWYEPAGGSGPARIRATWKGDTQTKIISPGSQSGPAQTHVADIILRADGTFTLQ